MIRLLISAAKAYLAAKAVQWAASAFAGRRSDATQPAAAKPGPSMAKQAKRPATRSKAAA